MRSPLAHKACAAGRTRRRGGSSRRLAAGLTAAPPIQLRVKNIDQNDHASSPAPLAGHSPWFDALGLLRTTDLVEYNGVVVPAARRRPVESDETDRSGYWLAT